MYYHFIIVGILALCVMAGFFYRVTSWLLFIGFTYWFLLDETRYLNHLYLVSLLAFLMALMPAHRAKSFDARLRRGIRSDTIPAWCVWLLRFQVGLVYFFAGVAKLNGDWLRLEPIRTWIAKRADYPVIGPWLETDAAAWFFGYGGLMFDLIAAPALMWRKTRPWAFAACVLFHVLNAWLFDIGTFPVIMLVATLIMFSPDWPRKVCLFFVPMQDSEHLSVQPHTISQMRRNLTIAFVVSYMAAQTLIPLRHYLYPGNVHWTAEGHRFAWHMKLRGKRAEAEFYATDPTTTQTWKIRMKDYLSKTQRRRAGRWPDMCLQLAHHAAEDLRRQGYEQVEIRVRSMATLNGRERQLLIDPDVDLSQVSRSLWPAKWILPLQEPLPSRYDKE